MSKLYILHGWTYSLDRWQPFLEMLKSQNIEPIVLNVPGLTEKSDKIWNIANYVDWLNRKLEKEIEPVILMGHSNGGRIAMNFAIKHPGKIKQLILLDSAGIYHDELLIKLKRNVFKTIARAGKKLTRAEFLRKLLYKAAGVSDYEQAPVNMRQTMTNMLTSDRELNPGLITAPTVIIWGRNDKTTPLGDGEKLAHAIQNSQLFIIDDARHGPHLTRPKEVADIIAKVIK